MNCDLWRSHGRIFSHWTLLFVVLVGRNFVCGICNLKHKTLEKPKNIICQKGFENQFLRFSKTSKRVDIFLLQYLTYKHRPTRYNEQK